MVVGGSLAAGLFGLGPWREVGRVTGGAAVAVFASEDVAMVVDARAQASRMGARYCILNCE